MKLTSFDVETRGVLQEYALQPFRLRTGLAWLTMCAMASKDDGAVSIEKPTREQLKAWLDSCKAQGVTICGWNIAFDMAWLIAMGLRDEVYANQWLDGMALWRHLVSSPKFTGLEPMKMGLKAAVAQYLPAFANYAEDINFDTDDPEEFARLVSYNKHDAVFTLFLCTMFLKQLTPRQIRTLKIEAACLPMVSETYVEGICINVPASQVLEKTLTDTANLAMVKLKLNSNEDIDPSVLASPAKLRKLLYEDWGLRAPKYTEKGAASTDRDALSLLADIDPRASLLNEYREATNNRTKFATGAIVSAEYNGDGRSRPQARVFGTYCVPGDVEVLTRTGWVALREWTGGEIMQVRPDSSMEFLPADRFVGPMVDSWVHVHHRRINCLFTHGHNMPHLKQKTYKWSDAKAEAFLSGSTRYVPVAGIAALSGGLTPEQMRVLAMVQADGYFPQRGGLRFTFKKERKIARSQQLLAAAGVDYSTYVCAFYPDRIEIKVGKKSLPAWINKDRKVLGSWLLDTSTEGLRAFVDEVVHWDGSHHQDGGVKYTSGARLNAEWVATAAALAGKKASLHAPAQGMQTLHISEQRPTVSVVPRQHVVEVRHTAQAYCAVTQTGYWLARSNGCIFVTGNTGRMTYSSKIGRGKAERPTGVPLHQWKRSPDFRDQIDAPEGYELLEFDFAGQEFRWMAVMSRDQTMLKLCEPGEDAHAFMGSRIRGFSYEDMRTHLHGDHWNGTDMRALAKQYRQLGKVANLSLQYRTSAATLRRVARVQHGVQLSDTEARAIHATYLSTYPGVKRYWKNQIRIARTMGYVETVTGRRIQLGREYEWTDDTIWGRESAAINSPIQGSGAEQKYLALAVLKNYLPRVDGRFYMELHDGLFVIVPHRHVDRAIVEIKELLSNLPYEKAWGVNLPVQFPVDAKRGLSWGQLKEVL